MTKLISILLLLLSSFTSKTVAQDCSLCPNGSQLEDLTRGLAFRSGTCGSAESLLRTVSNGSCDVVRESINSIYDQTAFCCSGIDPPDVCVLCGEHGTPAENPNTLILPSLHPDTPSTLQNGGTCGSVNNLAQYIKDEAECEAFQKASTICCDYHCALCPEKSSIENPSRELIGEGMTCAEADAVLTPIPFSQCGPPRGDINSIYDQSAVCCSGVDPPGECSLCGDGVLANPGAIVPFTGGKTCIDIAISAAFIVDPTTCDIFHDATSMCCGPAPPTSPPEPAGPCGICPPDSEIVHQDRPVPLSDPDAGTCVTFSAQFAELAEDECAATVAAANTVFDYTSWCGCQVVNPTDGPCQICPQGNAIVRPDRVIPRSDGATCASFNEELLFEVESDACTVKKNEVGENFHIAFWCGCEGAEVPPPENPCQLCPEGRVMVNPNKAIPFGEEGETCGTLNEQFSAVWSEICEDTVLDVSRSVDYRAWCECSGSFKPDNACVFCGGSPLFDVSIQVPETNQTCGDLKDLAEFVLDEETCNDMREARPLCCDNQNPTCSICPPGSILGNPEQELTIGDSVVMTCLDLNELVSYTPQDECAETIGNEDFSVASWCGCEGVEAPEDCSLCGPDDQLKNAEFEIPGTDGWTCEYAEEFARHVTNATICEEQVKLLAGVLCGCEPKPTPCSLCPEWSAIEDPSREGPLGVGSCDSFERSIGKHSSDCQVRLDESNNFFDLSSICCVEVAPPGQCNLCGEGGTLINTGATVEMGIAQTCQSFHDLVPAVTDPVQCQDMIDAAASLCCQGGSASGAPTRCVSMLIAGLVVMAGSTIMLSV
jgi:hypothetical protein